MFLRPRHLCPRATDHRAGVHSSGWGGLGPRAGVQFSLTSSLDTLFRVRAQTGWDKSLLRLGGEERKGVYSPASYNRRFVARTPARPSPAPARAPAKSLSPWAKSGGEGRAGTPARPQAGPQAGRSEGRFVLRLHKLGHHPAPEADALVEGRPVVAFPGGRTTWAGIGPAAPSCR